MANEVFKRRAEAAGIMPEPVGEELRHLGHLGCVICGQGYSGHVVAAFPVAGGLAVGLAIVWLPASVGLEPADLAIAARGTTVISSPCSSMNCSVVSPS